MLFHYFSLCYKVKTFLSLNPNFTGQIFCVCGNKISQQPKHVCSYSMCNNRRFWLEWLFSAQLFLLLNYVSMKLLPRILYFAKFEKKHTKFLCSIYYKKLLD